MAPDKKERVHGVFGTGLLLLCGCVLAVLSFSSLFGGTWLIQAQRVACQCDSRNRGSQAHYGHPTLSSVPAARVNCSRGGTPSSVSAHGAQHLVPSPHLVQGKQSSPTPPLSMQVALQSPLGHQSSFTINITELNYVGMEGDRVCQAGSAKGLLLNETDDTLISPVVVVGHNRVHYLARCLMALLRHWKADQINERRFPLFVSIDGVDARALSFSMALREATGIQVIARTHDPMQCDDNECHISLHYKMLLQLFFRCMEAPRLIFLEEDLEVSPDFFSYFANTYSLLALDKTLQCISSWNDQAQRGRALNNTALYRTDIFPGLGWMLDRERALEWVDMWPKVAWDDWMRAPNIRKGRSCLFPEMPRVLHYGRWGTHTQGPVGQWFYNTFLANIVANTALIDWGKQNVTYVMKDKYDQMLTHWLAKATMYDGSRLSDLRDYCDTSKPMHLDVSDLYVVYRWNDTYHGGYQDVVQHLPGMIMDIRGGKPRSSYNGIVILRCRGRRLFLRPTPYP